MNPSTRLTVSFSPRVNTALEKLAEEQGLTKSEVLRRALTLYEYVQHETSSPEKGRKKLAILDEQNNTQKEIVLG